MTSELRTLMALIDRTIPSQLQWVADLINQRIKKFSCQGTLDYYEPLDGDPLMDIHIKEGHSEDELKRRFIPRSC